MKSFAKYELPLRSLLLTEDKNTHLEHLEDDIINNGVAGGQNALKFLESLRDMLDGHSSKKMSLTVKWDGAPALFAGTNPENGKFFVGSKSVFNKSPKLNYTNADIDANHGGGLADKLKIALKEFPKLNIPGVWQGDLLYTSSDLESDNIDGESMVTFRPNTITYAVPEKSDLAKKIKGSNIGIVWHTSYSGDSIATMKATFGVNASQLKSTSSIWSTDAGFSDESGTATMTSGETEKFNNVLRMAGGSLKAGAPFLKVLEKDQDKDSLSAYLKIFFNTQIREGTGINDTKRLVAEFEKYYSAKMMKKIGDAKSDAGKKKYTDAMNNGLKEYKRYAKPLYFVVASYITIKTAKMLIIRKLNQIRSSVSSFLKTSDGYKITNPEGFVAIDHVGKALKLVDRMEFSRANFTAAKNWG